MLSVAIIIEVIVLLAIGGLLFIVIRRLPEAKHVGVPTVLTKISAIPKKSSNSYNSANIRGMGTNVFKRVGAKVRLMLQNLLSRLSNIPPFKFLRKKGKKEKLTPEQELAKQVKKPEDRSFWVEDGEKKEAEATAHLISATFFEQAEEAFKRQDYRRAETLYLEAARENPRNAKIFNRLGVIYLEQQNFGDAIEAFQSVIKFDDRVGSRHFNLALAYLGQGNYDDAKKSLEKAVKLTPGNDKYKKLLEETKKKC